MKETFKYFINQIPKEISSKTETHTYKDIILFRPQSFVIGCNMDLIDYHFVLPYSSPPIIKIGKQQYQFNKKRLLSFTPGTNMICTKHTSVPTHPYIAISINKDFFVKTSREAFGKPALSFKHIDYPYSSKLINLIYSFEDDLVNFEHSCKLMLQSISIQIVIQILRETENYHREKKIHIKQNYVNLAKEYMMAYYASNLKIEDICEQIYLSPSYFLRMFKEKTGQTPHEFLLSVRMNKAEEMLKKGDYTIDEIARLCGFVDGAHFSKYFKRVKGIPPSIYKRKNLL